MSKIVAGLFLLAVALSLAFFGHALATGIAVPYPDPTPEQAAHERYHRAISDPLFAVTAACWSLAGFAGLIRAGRWLLRRDRPFRVPGHKSRAGH